MLYQTTLRLIFYDNTSIMKKNICTYNTQEISKCTLIIGSKSGLRKMLHKLSVIQCVIRVIRRFKINSEYYKIEQNDGKNKSLTLIAIMN